MCLSVPLPPHQTMQSLPAFATASTRKRSQSCRSSLLDPQCKKRKQSVRKSVQFSSMIGQRIFIKQGWPSDQDHIAICTNADVDRNKRHIKTLTRLHRQTLSTNTNEDVSARTTGAVVANAVRCEMKGESLRGMEHITDASIGRTRRELRKRAIRVALESQEQMIQDTCDIVTKDRPSAISEAYKSEARTALKYAKFVAEEDAKIAAEIIEQDLQGDTNFATVAAPSSSCNRDSFQNNLKVSGVASSPGCMREDIIRLLLLNNNFLLPKCHGSIVQA